MGKIQNELPKLIMEAMKEKNQIRKNAYTNLKTEFMKYTTSKEGAKECTVDEKGNKVIADAKELAIVKKMHDELVVNGTQYGLDDYIKEAFYLEPFIPAAASEEDVKNAIAKYVAENGEFTQKQMGLVVKFVKAQFENVDGALVANQIKTYLAGK